MTTPSIIRRTNATHPPHLPKVNETPSAGDRWLDGRGEAVTITGVSFSRVTFVRDGYEHPCVYPVGRFTREFKPAAKETK